MLFLLAASALAAPISPGDSLEESLGIHLADAGLAELGNVVEALLPPSIPFTNVSGELSCDSDDANPLNYTLGDMELTITAQDVAIETSPGRMDIWMFITIASSESTLDLNGDCTFLTAAPDCALCQHLQQRAPGGPAAAAWI